MSGSLRENLCLKSSKWLMNLATNQSKAAMTLYISKWAEVYVFTKKKILVLVTYVQDIKPVKGLQAVVISDSLKHECAIHIQAVQSFG